MIRNSEVFLANFCYLISSSNSVDFGQCRIFFALSRTLSSEDLLYQEDLSLETENPSQQLKSSQV